MSANHVPVYVPGMMEREPYNSTPFGKLLFRLPRMIGYFAPTVGSWNIYFQVDDFGNCTQVSIHGMQHYRNQDSD